MLIKLIIFLAVVLGLAFMFYTIWRRKDKDALLRQHPAELAFFEAELPADFMDSNIHMSKFYASMRDLLTYNPEAAESGLGVLHAGIYTERKNEAMPPIAHFFLACDADKVNDVKARLGTSFGNDLVLNNIDEHPFKEELEKSQAAFPVTRPFQDWHDKRADKKAKEQFIEVAKEQGMSDEEIQEILAQVDQEQ